MSLTTFKTYNFIIILEKNWASFGLVYEGDWAGFFILTWQHRFLYTIERTAKKCFTTEWSNGTY